MDSIIENFCYIYLHSFGPVNDFFLCIRHSNMYVLFFTLLWRHWNVLSNINLTCKRPKGNIIKVKPRVYCSKQHSKAMYVHILPLKDRLGSESQPQTILIVFDDIVRCMSYLPKWSYYLGKIMSKSPVMIWEKIIDFQKNKYI